MTETTNAIRRIAVTGSSGYYGGKLIEHLRRELPGATILGIDVRKPGAVTPDEFAELDIRDPALAERLRAFAADTVIHLAFVLNPMHDESLMHAINIDGSRNVCDAVAALGPARFLTASSATAYGAWPDNPLPIDESWPTRPRREFSYAADKAELDAMLQRFAADHPETAVSWTRPAIIYGPKVDNYLSRSLLDFPVVMLVDGRDTPMQFVHEDDVVAATWAILKAGARGAFNVAPPDWLRLREVAGELGKRAIRVRLPVIRAIAALGWTLKLRRFESPPGILLFFRWPWVVDPKRLRDELGFRFQYSSRDTLREMVRTHRG